MAKPSWYYARQAQQAEARENFFRNRVPPESSTIESKGPATEVYYRSLLLNDGTNPLIFRTSVDNVTLNLVTAGEAGLMTTLGADDIALPLRGSGVRPTRVQWYRGTTTPVRRRTDWGTSVARYYDTQGGRSHFSIPFSRASGAFQSDEILAAFTGLFGPGGSKRGVLGGSNGRAAIQWERAVVSAQT